MIKADDIPLLERQLLTQLERLERQIKELNDERLALQRFIMKVRRENVTARDVARKNSFDRILVENRVLEMLREAPKPVQTYRLFEEAKLVNNKLKNGTFRSHLNRMKERGLIKQVSHGFWTVAQPTTLSP